MFPAGANAKPHRAYDVVNEEWRQRPNVNNVATVGVPVESNKQRRRSGTPRWSTARTHARSRTHNRVTHGVFFTEVTQKRGAASGQEVTSLRKGVIMWENLWGTRTKGLETRGIESKRWAAARFSASFLSSDIFLSVSRVWIHRLSTSVCCWCSLSRVANLH